MFEKFIFWLENSSADFQFALYFGLLILFTLLEVLIPKRKNQNRKHRWFANYFLTILSIITLSFLPVSFISAAYLAKANGYGVFNYISLDFVWSILVVLLIRGFISFFTHFLAHKIPLMWRFHRVHHLDTELDVTTTVRFHPGEFVFNIIIGVPIVVLFGLDPIILLFYELLDVVVTMISHTNMSLPKRVEKVIRYIIVTPDLHRVHHSSRQPETDSNFSAVFPIWDIIFRTFKTKTRVAQKDMELGLEEVRDERTNNPFWLLISPFKNISKKLENQ